MNLEFVLATSPGCFALCPYLLVHSEEPDSATTSGASTLSTSNGKTKIQHLSVKIVLGPKCKDL